MNRKYMHMFLAGMLMLALMAAVPFPALAVLTVKANHDQIDINYNYHGSTVSVNGISDPESDIVIKISSEDSEQKLMRKDKRAGLLWMNVEALHFSHIPNVYLLKSTRPLDQILNKEQELSHSIGYEALGANAKIIPDRGAEQRESWFGQFVQYKESNHLFKQMTGGIEVKADSPEQTYSAVFEWPFEAPPGKYDVEVLEVKNGSVVESRHSTVDVEQIGAVKMLANMAKTKGALYGVLSILIALAAGFGVGAVFGKGGGAH